MWESLVLYNTVWIYGDSWTVSERQCCYTESIILIILQKKVMRIVCHARSLDHTSKMFCQLDILKIYDLIDFNTCIFMYKVFHKLVPLTLQN